MAAAEKLYIVTFDITKDHVETSYRYITMAGNAKQAKEIARGAWCAQHTSHMFHTESRRYYDEPLNDQLCRFIVVKTRSIPMRRKTVYYW